MYLHNLFIELVINIHEYIFTFQTYLNYTNFKCMFYKII